MTDIPHKYDLDETVDEQDFLKDTPVYCPVPWCTARNLRHARCGDDEGDYEGIHIARMKYVETYQKIVKKELKKLSEFAPDPEHLWGLLRLRQDSIDMGMMPGKPGRRRLV